MHVNLVYKSPSLLCFFQAQTMQMMYEVIARELKNSNLENAHPQDYLNFYCLGNREQCEDQVSNSGNHSSSNGGGSVIHLSSTAFLY